MTYEEKIAELYKSIEKAEHDMQEMTSKHAQRAMMNVISLMYQDISKLRMKMYKNNKN